MTTADLVECDVPDTFEGIVPGPRDTLGDVWARNIGDLFDRTREAEAPDLSGAAKHRVWLVWQWLYCTVAGQTGRVIASPHAIIAAGLPLTGDEIDEAQRLLLASQKYLA